MMGGASWRRELPSRWRAPPARTPARRCDPCFRGDEVGDENDPVRDRSRRGAAMNPSTPTTVGKPMAPAVRVSRTMRAVVKASTAPSVEIREVPVPSPGPGEVLVKVLRAGVCGTDLHIYSWDRWSQQRIRPPITLGHEF